MVPNSIITLANTKVYYVVIDAEKGCLRKMLWDWLVVSAKLWWVSACPMKMLGIRMRLRIKGTMAGPSLPENGL